MIFKFSLNNIYYYLIFIQNFIILFIYKFYIYKLLLYL